MKLLPSRPLIYALLMLAAAALIGLLLRVPATDVGIAVLLYFGVRGLTQSDVGTAIGHGFDVLAFERRLGLGHVVGVARARLHGDRSSMRDRTRRPKRPILVRAA